MKDLNKVIQNINKKFKDIKNFEYKETENYIMISMPKTTKAQEWFTEWNKNEFQPLKVKVNKIESRLERIENCPTIKKELAEQNK